MVGNINRVSGTHHVIERQDHTFIAQLQEGSSKLIFTRVQIFPQLILNPSVVGTIEPKSQKKFAKSFSKKWAPKDTPQDLECEFDSSSRTKVSFSISSFDEQHSHQSMSKHSKQKEQSKAITSMTLVDQLQPSTFPV